MNRKTKIAVYLIGVFFIIKALMLVNAAFINKLFFIESGLAIIAVACFVSFIFFGRIIVKRHFGAKLLRYFWVAPAFLTVIVFFFKPLLTAVFLFGSYFYIFLYAEAQLIKTIEEKLNFPRVLTLTAGILMYYVFGKMLQPAYAYAPSVFAIEAIIVFLASFTIEKGKKPVVIMGTWPPGFLGPVFLAASVTFFYLGGMEGFVAGPEIPIFTSVMILLFYAGGATLSYLYIDHYLNRVVKLPIGKIKREAFLG